MSASPPRRRVAVVAGLAAIALGAGLLLPALALLGVDVPGLVGDRAPAAAAGAPHYVEEAMAAGVEHRYEGDYEYFVGGGVAVFDCNADGLPELYIAGGSSPAALFHNNSPTGAPLAFSRLADAATDLPAVTGAYPLDIDGDGQVDLAVLRRGENVLLRGLGDCRFERANERWNFAGGDAWTTAFSARWEDGSTLPTLAVGNYVDEASRYNDRLCHDNEVFRPAAPDGAGYLPPVPLAPGWCALSMLFSDWDRSGRADLRVSNDRHYYSDYSDGQEQLWRIDAGQDPRPYTRDDGWQPVRIWGMGIASADLTGDGFPEYFLSSQGDNKLQSLADGPGQPRYQNVALALGATAHRPFTGGDALPSTAWHAEFQDVNNDGFLDLFIAKGNVEKQPGYAEHDPSNLLLGQADGTFIESAEEAGVLHFDRGRGAALVDLNADGLLDLVEVVRRENVKVWRNVGAGDAGQPQPMGNWLAVQLQQPDANQDAIGAWIEVRAGDRVWSREVTVGGGHGGGQLGPLHFGLGGAGRVELRVIWPDGVVGPWLLAAASQRVTVERGADAVRGEQ